MRTLVRPAQLSLSPGSSTTLAIEVTNELDVIDGVVAAVEAPPGLTVTVKPELLALFPDQTDLVHVTLTPDATFPAGLHELPILIRSSVDPTVGRSVPVRLDVAPAPRLSIEVAPAVRRARRQAKYTVAVSNLGNTTVEGALAATDPDRALTTSFSLPEVRVDPGQRAESEMLVRGPRHIWGSDRSRILTVLSTSPGLEIQTSATFRQRPIISSGIKTIAILTTIVAAWAVIFVLALSHAFAQDPLTKDVPPSFYAGSQAAQTASGRSALSSLGNFELSNASNGDPALPAGATPKNGVVIGIGGTINGTITAASTGSGVGRITVEAVRMSNNGPVLVASAATAADGTYSVQGLLPGDYFLELTSLGYDDTWYTGKTGCPAPPGVTSMTEAAPVTVDAMATGPPVDACIAGQPASISGTVITGSLTPLPVTVSITPEQGSETFPSVVTDASGNYTVPNLPAPGTYELGFKAAGFQQTTDTEIVSGGENHTASTIDLTANTGTLGGTVTDGTQPLGGVVITAAANGRTFTSATPTTGAVGQFTIAGLPTPATYLLTFTKSGYGTDTVAQTLGPGATLNTLNVAMTGGAGQVSGTVKSSSGALLGGVTVTVNGGTQPVTTQTLTAGQVGTYHLSGLTTPGSYTLTFSEPGYTSETVGVSLASGAFAQGVNVVLPSAVGSISGTVSKAGRGGLSGVTVTVTDGTNVDTTTTTSSPLGGYSLAGLPPGAYSVTFSITGYSSQTALVFVSSGQSETQNVTLEPGS